MLHSTHGGSRFSSRDWSFDIQIKSQALGMGSITKGSYESGFHRELLSVFCEIELLADGVQGRRHLRKGTRSRILALMADPWIHEIRINSLVGKPPDNWNAPAWFSLCYFCLTHLNHGLKNYPFQMMNSHDPTSLSAGFPYLFPTITGSTPGSWSTTMSKATASRYQPASQSSELGRAIPPRMLGHCRKTPKAPQKLPPWYQLNLNSSCDELIKQSPAHRVNMSIFPHCSVTSVPQLQTKQQELARYSRWPVHLIMQFRKLSRGHTSTPLHCSEPLFRSWLTKLETWVVRTPGLSPSW